MSKHTRPVNAEYCRNYNRGWKWAGNMPDAAMEMGGLNYADQRGWTRNDAWVDGFQDYSIGDGIDRAKWHSWHSSRGTETNCDCVS